MFLKDMRSICHNRYRKVYYHSLAYRHCLDIANMWYTIVKKTGSRYFLGGDKAGAPWCSTNCVVKVYGPNVAII